MTGAPQPVVNVHWVRVDRRTAAHFDALVSPAERDRAARYRQPEDQWRSVVGAGALRWVVGRELGLGPAEVQIERTCPWCGGPHGRPLVAGADLHVSLSHAGEWVVVASSRAGPVGVDVEHLDPAMVLPMPADLILGPGERAADDHGLMPLWVAKEAYLKAIGTGLTVPPAEVSVRGSRVALPGSPSGRLARLGNRPGYLAAVCLTGRKSPRVVETDLPVPQRD